MLRAGAGPINGLAVSADGLRLCTTGQDKALKLYDVLTFDLSYMIDVEYTPTAAAWIHRPSEPHGRVVVADADSPNLRVYRTDGSTEPVHVVTVHTAPVGYRGDQAPSLCLLAHESIADRDMQVMVLGFSRKDGIVVSGDKKGVLEFWSNESYAFPRGQVSFKVNEEEPSRSS